MNLHFVPSLQHITLSKISIAVCNQSEIKAILREVKYLDSCLPDGIPLSGCFWSMLERPRNTRFRHYEFPVQHHNVPDDVLKQVQEKAADLISPINLAPALKKKILNFVPLIVLELKKWEKDHSGVLPAEFDAQGFFCWKSVGTIDRERTAENLLNNGSLSIKNRFFLSCLYCMETHLSFLWNGLYDSYKAHVISKCHSRSLLNYWITYLDGLHSRRSIFPDASFITNKSALLYFYNKCGSNDRKQDFLNDVLRKQSNNSDLVCFIVPKLWQNHFEQLSGGECRYILSCFLLWPLQILFLDMFEHMLVKLGLFEMNDLLHEILRNKRSHKYLGIDYLNILKELWGRIPADYKDLIRNRPDFPYIRSALEQMSENRFMQQ